MVATSSNETVMLDKPIKLNTTPSPRVTISYSRNTDRNHIEVEGQVIKIWSRLNGDVLVRISMPGREKDSIRHVNLLFEGGKLQGKDVSLMEGDTIEVQGSLSTSSHYETLKEFLARCEHAEIIQTYPELDAIANFKNQRSINCVIPSTIEYMEKELMGNLNMVHIEGTVSSIWDYMGSKYCRLNIHDNQTYRDPKKGDHRRFPYTIICFKNGTVDGRQVNLLPRNSEEAGIHIGDRIRVSGPLEEEYVFESLRNYLMRMRKVDLLTNLPNAGDVGDISSKYIQSIVLAKIIIQYSSTPYRGD
jgi:hypothetical protein